MDAERNFERLVRHGLLGRVSSRSGGHACRPHGNSFNDANAALFASLRGRGAQCGPCNRLGDLWPDSSIVLLS